MRHNFVNDIGDYAKYALLRAVCASSPTNIRLGVLWYLTEHVELNGDGRRRPHLSRDGWEDLDPVLLKEMRVIENSLGSADDLHLSLIENSPILPADTVFFSDPLPHGISSTQVRIKERALWFKKAQQATSGCNLVFLDPDNGLEVRSVKRSSPLASKYVTVEEIESLLLGGSSVVLYQHCDRSPWQVQRARIVEQLTSGVALKIAVRSLRFGAFGARVFFCISAQSDGVQTIDQALVSLQDRVSVWDKSHYLLVE